MREQQEKFKKEIEALRKALEAKTTVDKEKDTSTDDTLMTEAKDAHCINVEDSSTDEKSTSNNDNLPAQPSPTRSVKSPAHKRPKRGRGGRSSSISRSNE